MTFAPRTWVVGEVVTAALLNQEIRDQFNSMFAAWTSYTPTWTSSTNPAIGNGTLAGAYIKWGRTCIAYIRLAMGSTTTYGSGGYTFGLPFTSASGMDYLGTARLVSTDAWNGQTVMNGGTSGFNATFPTSSGDSRSATLSATVPNTLASGHIVRMSMIYQTAS